MMPNEFWKHLHTHYNYQSLYWYHSPLLWDKKNFKLRKNRIGSIKFWVANTFITIFVGVYCLVFLLIGILTKWFDLTFFQIVVCLGESIITTIGYVIGGVSLLDQDNLCQCMNGIFNVARKAPTGILIGSKKRGRGLQLTKADRSMLMLLTFFRRAVILTPFVTFFVPFALSSDPIYFLIDGIVHKILINERSWLSVLCETLVRCVLFSMVATHMVFDIYQFMICLAIILYVQLKLFSGAYIKRKWTPHNAPYKQISIPGKNTKACVIADDYTRSLNFNFVYGIYRRIQIIGGFHDLMTMKLYPPGFALVYSGGVLASFVVLTGYNFVPNIVYLMAILLAIVVLVVFSFVFPRFCDFDICSEEFYIFWERRLHGKLRRSKLASLRPVRVGIKPFFDFKRRLYMLVVWNMISFSITFFITFQDAFL